MKRKRDDIKPRLYDRLMNEPILWPLPPGDAVIFEQDVVKHTASIRSVLGDAKVVDATNVARFFEDTYLGEDKDGTEFWADLKCVAPPFPSFFVEWDKPLQIPNALRMGVLFLACPAETAEAVARAFLGDNAQDTPKRIATYLEQSPPPKWIYLTFDFLEFSGGVAKHITTLRGPYHVGCVAVDAEGTFDRSRFFMSYASGHVSREEYRQLDVASLTAWTALAMLNCDNIDQAEHPAAEHLQRSWTRRGNLPLVTYRTIHVNQAKTPRSISAPPLSAGGSPRLHKRRGHMKDYRHGAGLFGRYRGLWYWGPTLAGDAEAGAVVSDYEVAP